MSSLAFALLRSSAAVVSRSSCQRVSSGRRGLTFQAAFSTTTTTTTTTSEGFFSFLKGGKASTAADTKADKGKTLPHSLPTESTSSLSAHEESSPLADASSVKTSSISDPVKGSWPAPTPDQIRHVVKAVVHKHIPGGVMSGNNWMNVQFSTPALKFRIIKDSLSGLTGLHTAPPAISNVDLTNITHVRALLTHLKGQTKKPHNPYSKVDTVKEYMEMQAQRHRLPDNLYFDPSPQLASSPKSK